MNIVLDGVIFEQQARGGISRIYQEILPRICSLEPTCQIHLVTSGPIRSKCPDHVQITHHRLWPLQRYIQPGKYLWSFKKRVRSWIAGYSLTSHAHEIWHSTHYTLPHKWKGPILITAYDLLIERFAPLFDEPMYYQIRAEMRRSITAADGLICISETTKSDMIDIYQIEESKLHVVPLASNEIFQPLLCTTCKDELIGKKPFFLYVGQRGNYKNFKIVLDAWQIWRKKNEIDLVVVGNAWTEMEKKLLIQKNLYSHIQLVGNVNDEQLCGLYNRAKAFIYPSLYEGFGLPILEAMACGCPIIASRIPTTQEVAGEIPIYFDPLVCESLLDAFEIALNETDHSGRVRAGLVHCKQYSWERTAKQYLDVYQLYQQI